MPCTVIDASVNRLAAQQELCGFGSFALGVARMVEAVRCVSRNWASSLASLLRGTRRELVVCSPFVAQEGTRFIDANVDASFRASGRLTFLTNLSVVALCQLATDPRALESLVTSIAASSVYHLPGLHAKVYIGDEKCAIVTSGNLTARGLYRNYEYGLELTEGTLVRRIRKDVLEFAQLGAEVPLLNLTAYCRAVESVYESIRTSQLSAQATVTQRFHAALGPIEDELLRLRLAGGAVHTVFARTIEYLLRRHGPLETVQLHPMVAALHPDLCDDSVDRVIDGKRFGKKWKHAVRTAQQRLKSEGRIEYENGKWQMARSSLSERRRV